MAATYETSLAPIAVTFAWAGETETHAFNAGTGANRVLFVFVSWRDWANTITGVTYGGVAMTAAGAKVTQTILSAQLWILVNPASGSNNIAVTMSSNPSEADSAGQISAWVANTVDQSTATDGYVTNIGNGTTSSAVSSATVTSATGDRAAIFHAFLCGDEPMRSATPTNYTERQDAHDGGAFSQEFGDADGAASVAGSATWNNSAPFEWWWVSLGINVNAAVGGGNDLSVGHLGEPVIGGSLF